MLHPTHRSRTPYLFHFDHQTVALGDPHFLYSINEYLLTAKKATRPTFWDEVYLADLAQEFPDIYPQNIAEEKFASFAGPDRKNMLNSVGTDCTEQEFWQAVEQAVFSDFAWPVGNEPLYLPELPDWLKHARAWEFDPAAPSDGPGNLGGWVRTRGREGNGYPLGLFQLTDANSFWVFGSADDLDDVMALCNSIADVRAGFDQATAYFGQDARFSSIALPIECRAHLEEELFIAGIDVESLFWE